MPENPRGVKTLYRIKYRGINITQATSEPNKIKNGLYWGISKIWGESLGVNSIIVNSSFDYAGSINMILCYS